MDDVLWKESMKKKCPGGCRTWEVVSGSTCSAGMLDLSHHTLRVYLYKSGSVATEHVTTPQSCCTRRGLWLQQISEACSEKRINYWSLKTNCLGFVFVQSKEGKSPLHMAAIHGRFTRSQILIQNGNEDSDRPVSAGFSLFFTAP